MPVGTRVVIADDHPALRESLRTALLATGDFEITGEAATGRQALRLAIEQKPDVVVLDLHMPDMDGIAAAVRILDRVPACAIVLQSLSYGAPYVLKALGAGVRGFVAKGDGVECLLRAIQAVHIQTVHADRHYLSPAVTAELRSTVASLFSDSSTRALLMVFDREAHALLQGASTVTPDGALVRQALLQSFLAYAIACMGSDPVPDRRAWLLLSVVSFLHSRGAVPPQRSEPKTSFSDFVIDAMHRSRIMFQGHAHHGDFISDWRGALPRRSAGRLRRHLRNCPSCYLEWCLVGFAQASAGPDLDGALQDVRKQLADALEAADLGKLAEAWSSRGTAVRGMMASELRVLLGSAAAGAWTRAEDSATPVAWPGEFLGSPARRASSPVQAAMQTTTGLGG